MAEIEPIPIIGGTGALGAGLALRWARAGAPIMIGSRSPERAAEAAARVRAAVPGAEVEGLLNEEAARRGEIVFLTVPFRAQSENLGNLREALRPGQILVDCTVPLAAAVSGKATRSLGVWQGSAAQQAQEMVPAGVTVVSALHTVGAPTLADPECKAWRGCPGLRRSQGRQGTGRGANRADWRPACRQRRAAGDGAHRRAADPAPDLGQQPLQGPCRDPAHRPPRRRPLVIGVKVALLAGGTGGAKLGAGMQEEIGAELSVIANTGDDIETLGVHVSPDPDLITYWLSGEIDEERGWGLREDTFTVFERLARLGAPDWFSLSDRDLAACLYRRAFIEEGGRPTDAQAQIARALGVRARVLPMCDAPVRTKVVIEAGRRDLQEYLILDRGRPQVHGVELEGIEDAEPSREVLEALRWAEAIVIGPSNPVISIGPILAVPGYARGDRGLRGPGGRGQPLRRRAGREGADRPLHGGAGAPLDRSRRGVALRGADRCDGPR